MGFGTPLEDEGYGPDLIAVGSHGSHVTQVVQGSVAYRIVRLAGCPALVVR